MPDYWPTLAGKYVSDSRIDPIDDDIKSDERRPLIGSIPRMGISPRSRKPARCFTRASSISCLRFPWWRNSPVDGGAEPIIDFADTDAATEAQLDALEDQIFWCLHYSPTGNLFRQMAKLPFDEWTSTPHRSGEEAIKLARRTMRMPASR
jgi:hypothetical protein